VRGAKIPAAGFDRTPWNGLATSSRRYEVLAGESLGRETPVHSIFWAQSIGGKSDVLVSREHAPEMFGSSSRSGPTSKGSSPARATAQPSWCRGFPDVSVTQKGSLGVSMPEPRSRFRRWLKEQASAPTKPLRHAGFAPGARWPMGPNLVHVRLFYYLGIWDAVPPLSRLRGTLSASLGRLAGCCPRSLSPNLLS
jgi:hypothetical protein